MQVFKGIVLVIGFVVFLQNISHSQIEEPDWFGEEKNAYIFLEGIGNNGVLGINGTYHFKVFEDKRFTIAPSVGYGGFLFFDDVGMFIGIEDNNVHAIFPVQANLAYRRFGDGKNTILFGGGPTIHNHKNAKRDFNETNTTWVLETSFERDIKIFNESSVGIGGTLFLDNNFYDGEIPFLPVMRTGIRF